MSVNVIFKNNFPKISLELIDSISDDSFLYVLCDYKATKVIKKLKSFNKSLRKIVDKEKYKSIRARFVVFMIREGTYKEAVVYFTSIVNNSHSQWWFPSTEFTI